MSLTLLLGGARSGKSSFAVEMGRPRSGPVTYIATAPPIDDDMVDRIEHHRLERPTTWTTVEEETELETAVGGIAAGMVIIDCLTLWTSNLMERGESDEQISTRAAATALLCANRTEPVVVISNEVGLGVHPETPLGRRYRDVLGRVNQIFARVADPALLMVAGRALPLADPRDLLGS